MATEELLPMGAGAYTALATFPTEQINWQMVDDPVGEPDETSTQVRPAEVDTQIKDAYELEDSGVGAGTINSVRVYFRWRCSSVSWEAWAQPFLRLDTNETEGTELHKDGDTNWTTNSEILARPGGDGWSWADINALQVCIGLKCNSSPVSQCTQVYVEVDYDPAPEGWTGIAIGVTNPGKVIGVDVANVGAVIGVA